ncbi:hypothetical protein OIU80_11485 [Flavobacterium sp. LS1R47]|uniref:Uncharacterized protein n=1 Tax=Flavobacterium frigoritolerans TaxID=2987686 RepID=A0A9X3C840_9FLAO|nr:hypothetical protein [Flavobacterium frigoritolerans]MCV9932907.1 hypothetical protein [Flavobacterium frigoritolerans]
MKKKLIILCLMTFSLLTYSQSQVGINTFNPTQTLDVNGGARVRNMKNINTEALTLEYNHQIVANSDGNLGYVLNSNTTVPWSFNDNKYDVLTKPISSGLRTGRVPLNFSITISIPAKSQAQVVINYNMPVMHSSHTPNTIGYLGCTLYKSVNDGSDIELDMGSRKYTVPNNYNGIAVTALGMPVAGFAIDIISNPGDTPMNVAYKVDGYVESNAATVTFGMYTASPGINYNWGRGVMSAQIFTKPIN